MSWASYASRQTKAALPWVLQWRGWLLLPRHPWGHYTPVFTVQLWNQAQSFSNFSNLRERVLVAQCLTLVTAWTAAHQASLFMGFPRQEYWSALPFLSLGDFPNLGIDPGLLPCRQILYHLSHKGNSNLRVLSISWYISESHTCNQMHRRKNILVTVIF